MQAGRGWLSNAPAPLARKKVSDKMFRSDLEKTIGARKRYLPLPCRSNMADLVSEVDHQRKFRVTVKERTEEASSNECGVRFLKRDWAQVTERTRENGLFSASIVGIKQETHPRPSGRKPADWPAMEASVMTLDDAEPATSHSADVGRADDGAGRPQKRPADEMASEAAGGAAAALTTTRRGGTHVWHVEAYSFV